MPDGFSENSKLQEKLFLPPSDWPLRPRFTKLGINVRGTCLKQHHISGEKKWLVTLHHKVSPMSYLRNPATPVSITNIYKCLVSTFGYLYIRSVSWRIGHRRIST